MEQGLQRLAAHGLVSSSNTKRARKTSRAHERLEGRGLFGRFFLLLFGAGISWPVAWSTTFIDRRTLPRSSKPSSLTQTLWPSLTTSLRLGNALGSELRDVDEAVAGAEEVDEGAEVGGLDDRAFVDLADFRLGDDRVDPLAGRFDFLAGGRSDLDGAVVFDVDLGAGLFDDFADDLAAGADDFTDLVDRDVHDFDARSEFAELAAAFGDGLGHFAEDVQAAALGLARARPS